MPKLKTHRGAAKRFKKTAGGKFLRAAAFKRHILTSKTTKRKRVAARHHAGLRAGQDQAEADVAVRHRDMSDRRCRNRGSEAQPSRSRCRAFGNQRSSID